MKSVVIFSILTVFKIIENVSAYSNLKTKYELENYNNTFDLEPHRNLVEMSKGVTSSRSCKKDCIDLLYNFCPTNA